MIDLNGKGHAATQKTTNFLVIQKPTVQPGTVNLNLFITTSFEHLLILDYLIDPE